MKPLLQNRTAEQPLAVWDSMARFGGYLSLALTLAAVAFDLIVLALHSPPLTDDVMAQVSARSASLPHMLTLLLVQPVNVDAPVFPILAFLSARLPLPIEIAIAVPAMCGIFLAVIATFLLVRDWLGTSGACVAIVMLTITPYLSFGARPRPYAFLLGMMCVSVLCWARATEFTRRRKLWLPGLCVSVTLTLLTHYFAVFSILAIVLAELVRFSQQKKLDWPIWIALGIPALIFLPVYAIFAPGGEPYRAHPFDGVHLPDLIATYAQAFRLPQLLFMAATAWLIARVTRKSGSFQKLSATGYVLATALCLGPVLVFLTGVLYSHTYVLRYGICVLLGVAILAAALVTATAGGARRAILPGVLVVFLVHQVHFLRLAQTPLYEPQKLWPAAEPEILLEYGNIPLMTPDFDYAMRVHFYAPTWLSSRLVMVGSRKSMLRYMGTDAPTLAMQAIHRWTGWPMSDYETFVRTHRLFLMYGQYWAIEALTNDGATIRNLQDIGPYHLYLVTFADRAHDSRQVTSW